MKAFIASVAVALVMSVGAAYLLDAQYQKTADRAYVGSGARVGDPGNNLVGPNWYGSRS